MKHDRIITIFCLLLHYGLYAMEPSSTGDVSLAIKNQTTHRILVTLRSVAMNARTREYSRLIEPHEITFMTPTADDYELSAEQIIQQTILIRWFLQATENIRIDLIPIQTPAGESLRLFLTNRYDNFKYCPPMLAETEIIRHSPRTHLHRSPKMSNLNLALLLDTPNDNH